MSGSEPLVHKNSRLFADLCSAILERGNAVRFRVQGESMRPNLLDGDLITVVPVAPRELRPGDVALVQNADGLLVHRVNSCDSASGTVVTQSDTGLEPDSPSSRLLGKVTHNRRGSKEQRFNAWQARCVHPARILLHRLHGAAVSRLRRFAFLFYGLFVLALSHGSFIAPAAHAQTADLQLTQTAVAVGTTTPSITAVAAGTTYSYTEVVTNNSSSATVTSGTITVYLQTPANTTYQASAGTNWTCTAPTAGNAGPVVCTYNNTLNSGATASTLSITFLVTAGTASGTTIQSSATVTNSTFVDNVPANNTSLTSIVVEPTTTSDLALSMSVSPTPVFIDSNLTYTIQVQNLGQLSAPVTSNVLTDTLPAAVTLVSVSASSGWSCSGTNTISCSITSSMAMGATATIAITVTAPATATTLTNTATVSLAGDPNSANNSATSYTVVQPLVCATPGRDGAGGTLAGIVNTYFPPSSTGTLAPGSSSVALGAAAASGAQKAIAIGDLLLIIQMQDATIDRANTSSYGDGLPGDPGSGSTSLGSSGLFEFVTAASAVPLTGGTLTFTGTGPTGGLLNSYYQNADSSSQGQQTYQVIRVPQYTSATFSSTLTALAWNGSVGGVLAVDVSSQLTLGGTVALDSLGFRGGGGITLAGTTGEADTDYVTNSPANLPALNNTTQKDPPAGSGANASKGEGIAGTPHWVAPLLSSITTSSTALSTGQAVLEGLPSGSFARGAPGNAGGGGTDGDPAHNDYNSGGGAGGNGGSGGQGGYGWNSMAATNSTDGGFGGVAFPASTSALVMGGGGGAGTTNNGSYYISGTNHSADCGTNCTGIYSSGGAGGGIIIVHAGSVNGSGTITSNGQSTLSTDNDSTGGAGAGGSIIFLANSGTLSGLTVNAIGGSGGDAWPEKAPGGFPGQRHGPGGGGGGGVVFLSAAPASSNVAGGANGYTDTVQDSYGATPGQAGVVVTTHVITETPGTQPGAYCASADLSVTNSASPPVVAPGGNITYTQTVANAGPLDAVNAVFSEAVPANTTFQSISSLAGWTCVTPAVGGTGNITCTNPDFASSGSGTFTVLVQVAAAAPNGTQIADVDNITSGTNDPNLANNTATAITIVGVANSADLALTNTPSQLVVTAGSNVTVTAVLTNQGPSAASTLSFNEAIPANTTFVSFTPPVGWTCSTPPPGSGPGPVNVTCVTSTLAVGGTATFPVVLNVNSADPSGTQITAEATIQAATPDPNPSNNIADATFTVATAGQVDLAVSGSASPNPVTPGNNITYAQSVTNNGPTAITASATTTVTFTDAIPANTVLATAFVAPAGWTCSPAIPVGGTGTITCTLNSGQTLAVGAMVNFPLVVKVNLGTTPGTIITNSPNISSSVPDPNATNNTATITTLVASPTQADVSIQKTASPNPVDQGTNLTYTILVTNNGPAIAQGVTVTDPIPAQVTYASASSTQGTCTYSSSTTTVNCNLGSLAVGDVAVVTINVTAAVFGSGAVTCNGISNVYTSCNTASVATTTSNPNTSACVGSTAPVPNACAGTIIQAPTAVDLASFRALVQLDGSVRLLWRTLEESRNLGFHLYREDASGRHRVDPSLIAGSALMLRGSHPQHAAKLYAWIDSQPSPNAAYWIEDVDINGTRTLHGPAYLEPASSMENQPQVAAQAAEALPVSPTLSQFHSNALLANSQSPRIMTPRPILPVPPVGVPLFDAADHAAVKISVEQEGWYHVPFAQLFSAGLEPNTDVRLLHLYAEGIEQPLLLTGHTSGFASPTDAIEFYGTGIDTPFSGDRVYWLVRENSLGKRIQPTPAAASSGVVPTSFPFTVLREDRTVYFAALLNGENNDNFFGALVTSDPVDQTLTVVHRDTSSSQPLTLDLALQGATDAQLHSVSVVFNGA
ncbi:MAG TPA: S24 family peptidase, partial [Candidatus Sulfotelmatobacter sp.]|nr:S24 family peptidase [Candidatus Sulfotelmatobacter sp.]